MEAVQDYPLLKDPEMKEILESFMIETKEILEKLDLDLMELEKRPEDNELLNQVFRSFHTIKGTSGFFGLNKLTSVTHKCEDILNKLRKGEAKLNSGVMDSILLAYDKLRELLISIENKLNEDVDIEEALDNLTDTLDALENNKEIKPKEEPQKEKSKTKTRKSKKSSKELKVKENNEQEFVMAAQTDSNEPVNVEEIADDIEEDTEEEVKGSNENSGIKNEKNIVEKLKEIKQKDNTIRVDIERLDELLNIASELVLGRNRLAQVNSEFTLEHEGTKLARDLAEATRQIDLMMNELQLVVMKTRMVKIGKVFNRFPRVVRDLSKESKKNVRLELNGEETELDKTLIEEINDPLVHLIRNSIDHGIEPPEDRKKAGKDPTGTITLSAVHEGNHIIITIEDDGKGIDPEIIKEKAVKKGLISKEKAKELTVNDTYNLIFLPGFSTAEVVTNISGRGVGMDVVKTNVTKLRGLINIESKVGEGTKIIIKLPLTLAIIPGMIVKVDEQSMVIPLNSIIEVVRVYLDNINTISGREVIRMRDSVIPLIGVDELLNKVSGNKDKIWQYVVVVGIAEKRFGIKVDHLIGQKEIVIKSLGTYLGTIEGIAGSTILGDGTVIMILDIGELIHKLEQ